MRMRKPENARWLNVFFVHIDNQQHVSVVLSTIIRVPSRTQITYNKLLICIGETTLCNG